MITVDNCQFFSATEAGRMYGSKAAKIVKAQPGYDYRVGFAYCFDRTKSGAVRLYARIDDIWRDASLADIPDITIEI